MLAHEGGDERTARHHLETKRANRLEHAAHQGGPDPTPAKLRRDLGVDQRDDPGFHAVVDEGGVAIDVELEAIELGVVADAPGHGRPTRPAARPDARGAWQAPRASGSPRRTPA